MNIKIEEYMGIDIYYDENSDKFVTAVTTGEEPYQAKRSSLIKLREAIDKHFEHNEKIEFKPFKCLMCKYGTENAKTIWVKSVRTDGDLMVSDREDLSEAWRYSLKWDKEYLFEDNEHNRRVIAEDKEIRKQIKALEEKIKNVNSLTKVPENKYS